MLCFTQLLAPAAALPLANVDTDKILAGQYLKTVTREGLGTRLFSAMRYDENGVERPDFVLNRDPWRNAGILIALENFGCGSSREHAPWALLDFGISCVIATSFADIFYNNCFKNFILPIVLDRNVIDRLMVDAGRAESCRMLVDLDAQTIRRADGRIERFDIDPERKHGLLSGIDEIETSLQLLPQIRDWEASTDRIAPAIPANAADL